MGNEKLDMRSQAASHAVELLQGKWKIQVLCAMRSGPVRLGQLVRLIPGASKKVLAENLPMLEFHGIVIRRDLSGAVRHVEYDLTEEIKPFINSILDHLATLGEVFHERI